MSNPMEQLQPAWQKFKKVHASAVREVNHSYSYKSPAIQAYRWGQGVEWDRAARVEWYNAISAVLGFKPTIEWVGDARHPACVVNGVMMFT